MTARAQLGRMLKYIVSSVYKRQVALSTNTPIVSFSFDDFPRTAWTTGGGILRAHGVRGTYYSAPGLMNTRNDLGPQMTLDDISALVSEGHEIGCHTFSHSSCRRVSRRVYEADVLKGKETLQKITGLDPSSFAYPFGHVSVALKKRIGEQMTSCRSIYDGINTSTIDLHLLRANSLYGDLDQLAKAERLLSENEEQCGWLIFYTHDVQPNRSPWGCTPELLERTIQLAVDKGCSILPVGEVVKLASDISSKQMSVVL